FHHRTSHRFFRTGHRHLRPQQTAGRSRGLSPPADAFHRSRLEPSRGHTTPNMYVRNKRRADLAAFTPERTLLIVHGSTYPAHTGFDLPLGGQSWMEFIASRGYDVYCLDLRGYGRSTRPKEMDEPADQN